MLHEEQAPVEISSNHVIIMLLFMIVLLSAVIESLFVHTVFLLCSRLAFIIAMVCTAYLYSMCATTANSISFRIYSDVLINHAWIKMLLLLTIQNSDQSDVISLGDTTSFDGVSHVIIWEDSTLSDEEVLSRQPCTILLSVEISYSDRHLLNAVYRLFSPSERNLSQKTIDVQLQQPHHNPNHMSSPYNRLVEFYMDSACTNHVTHDLLINSMILY